jgi:hypothetical protein
MSKLLKTLTIAAIGFLAVGITVISHGTAHAAPPPCMVFIL